MFWLYFFGIFLILCIALVLIAGRRRGAGSGLDAANRSDIDRGAADAASKHLNGGGPYTGG